MYRTPDFPDQVYVELTNACNARCTTCATPQMLRPRRVMAPELFRGIIDQCARHQAKKILPFLHGESFLVPDVLDYFAYIRGKAPQSHLNVTTNGSRLTAEISERILEEDLLDSIIVSIDGGNKQTFEAIRLGLSYDEIRSNVLHLIRRRNELGKTRPHISIAMVTTPENRHTRDELQEAWKDALKDTIPIPNLRGFSRVQETVGKYQDEVMLGKSDIKTAMTKADAEVKQVLEEAYR